MNLLLYFVLPRCSRHSFDLYFIQNLPLYLVLTALFAPVLYDIVLESYFYFYFHFYLKATAVDFCTRALFPPFYQMMLVDADRAQEALELDAELLGYLREDASAQGPNATEDQTEDALVTATK